MKNILTIFLRELKAYFISPIGYIYIVVFLLINSFFYLSNFFVYPTADMKSMFNILPFIFCALIPLISMRLWAEDKKENTIEMLLTFPMNSYELVLGKYLASVVFFIIALSGTLTIPITLEILGNPDWGVIISSYLGAVLLGSLFLAIGIFLSAFVKDQIVAAVITLGVCLSTVIVGVDFIAMQIDGWVNGLGSLLKNIIGVTTHYDPFTLGIINIVDILYFLVWIYIFLFLNSLYLEGRNKPNYNWIYSGILVITLLIGIFFNFLTVDFYLGKFDLTEDKIYTLSDVSKKVLQQLKAPVNINIYITPKSQMPTKLKNLERDIVEKIKEMQEYSNNKLFYKVIHLKIKNYLKVEKKRYEEKLAKIFGKKLKKKKKEEEKEKLIEDILYDKGVLPFTTLAFKSEQTGSIGSQLVYSAIGIAYKAEKEKIIPKITYQNFNELEYKIIDIIYRLISPKKPVVVLYAPKNEVPPYIAQMLRQMGRPVPPPQDPYRALEYILKKRYEVKRIRFNKKDPLPKNYDALLIINPKELNKRQRWEIARALYSGKNVFLAVQNYIFNYTIEKDGIGIQKIEMKPNINELIKHYGVRVNNQILMDKNSTLLSVIDSSNPLQIKAVEVGLFAHIIVVSQNMNKKSAITSKLEQLPYFWGSALDIDKKKIEKNKLKLTVLMKSSKKAWLVPSVNLITNKLPKDESKFRQFPLMVMLEGQFPDVYKNKPRPKWPKPKKMPGYLQPDNNDNEEEPPAEKVNPKKAKLLLIGSSIPFQKDFFRRGCEIFYQNCVDSLVLKINLGSLRMKKFLSRRIDTIENPLLWRLVNYFLAPFIFIILGLSIGFIRKFRRNMYLENIKNNL